MKNNFQLTATKDEYDGINTCILQKKYSRSIYKLSVDQNKYTPLEIV